MASWRLPSYAPDPWLKRSHPNGGSHAPGAFPVAPVRAEHLRVARRAQLGDVDPIQQDTSGRELVARGRPTIEKPVVGSGDGRETRHRRIQRRWLCARVEPSLEVGMFEPCRPEPFSNVNADFVTARAN